MALVSAEIRWTPPELAEGEKLSKEEKYVAGDKITVAEVDDTEVKLFHDDYINLINRYQEHLYSGNAAVAQLFLDYEEVAFDLMRAVKERVDRNYQGRAAEGDGLVIDILRPKDFNKTSWLRTITSTGENDFLGTSASPFTLNKYSGIMIIGYIDRIASPKVDAVRYEKGSKKIPYKSLDFGLNSIEIEQVPMQVLPEGKIYIAVHDYATGDDAFQPLGIKVTTADKLIDPTTSPIV